jgi:diguanylate cyclase
MPSRLLLLTCLLALLSFTVSGSADSPEPQLISKAGELKLDSSIQYVEDPTGKLQFEDILKPDAAWKQNERHTFNHGYNDSTWWLKVSIKNPSDIESDQLFEVGYAVLDYVDIYVTENGRLLQTFNMGDKLPHYRRPIDHRFFVIPITWQPQQTLDIYVMIRSGSSIQAPMTLWNYERFYSADTASTILQGIYYGGMLVIAVYNLLIYVVLRSRNYLYYVGFVLNMPLFLASMSGQSFRYLWPDATTWNDQATVVFLAATLVFGTIFTRRFLRINDISRRLAQLLSVLATASFINGAMAFFVPYHICIQGLVLLGILSTSTGLFAGIYALIREQTSARIYVVAWFSFLVGSAILALNKLSILPNNLFTEYATQFGSIVEVVLLSFALAERINVERRLRFEAQTETLAATRKLNEELEERVAVRTAELEQLNHRLQELSDTDQLTGLKNRRFMETRLEREWTRCVRYRHALTVVLLDIDHFKQVNDRFGHPAGDACLQAVASLICEGLRWPSDMVARYGGEEFCLILPETSAEGAATVTERIRSRVAQAIIDAEHHRFQVTISAGIFSAIPDQDMGVEMFISGADKALYQSKEAGRNRVTVAA